MSLTVTGKLTPKRAAPAPIVAPRPPPPSRAALMLSLAHHVENLIERGALRDYADAARQLGVTRARMSQVMNLLMLAPEIQENILLGRKLASERVLRKLPCLPSWLDQVVAAQA